jgi:hypothetical protein
LAKSIAFNHLGLLIIDEEQHFGVGQKERLKELRGDIHVLTLSATPIPRTLQMALSGVREMSLIATPPVGPDGGSYLCWPMGWRCSSRGDPARDVPWWAGVCGLSAH